MDISVLESPRGVLSYSSSEGMSREPVDLRPAPPHGEGSDVETGPAAKKAKYTAAADGYRVPSQRIYKACHACRDKKVRCDLGDINNPSDPPCRRCRREKVECVFQDGPRRRRPKQDSKKADARPPKEKGISEATEAALPAHSSSAVPSAPAEILPLPFSTATDTSYHPGFAASPMSSVTSNNPATLSELASTFTHEPSASPAQGHRSASAIAQADLNNPSDALGILAMAADTSNKAANPFWPRAGGSSLGDRLFPERTNNGTRSRKSTPPPPDQTYSWSDYDLVKQGVLTATEGAELLKFYKDKLHDYAPLLPPRLFEKTAVSELVSTESFLLTAMMLTAARYHTLSGFGGRSRADRIHTRCWTYICEKIGVLFWNSKHRTVGTVEALLLLSEWAPKIIHFTEEVGTDPSGGEIPLLAPAKAFDDMAHLFLGAAIRLAQLLEIDNSASYYGLAEGGAKEQQAARRLSVWLACVEMDRNHSVRLARDFTAPIFSPRWRQVLDQKTAALLPGTPERDEWDHLQARVKLTTILSNLHQMLGDSDAVVKGVMTGVGSEKCQVLLEMSRSEVRSFKLQYSHLLARHDMRGFRLRLDLHYTRLYTCAYALQVIVNGRRRGQPMGEMTTLPIYTFILECMDAARHVIEELSVRLSQLMGLAFAPAKYFLRIVYAAVLLLKGCCTHEGIVTTAECISAVQKVITTVTDSCPDDLHLASRYAHLLRLLLQQLHFTPSEAGTAASSAQPATGSTATDSGPMLNTLGLTEDEMLSSADIFGTDFTTGLDHFDLPYLLSFPNIQEPPFTATTEVDDSAAFLQKSVGDMFGSETLGAAYSIGWSALSGHPEPFW